ncbi:hypothetical protein CEXT_567671 [Caerostris extrusa]|uniref:Uncharacterized protein n=1 Tax=Caerostris extrusa TaxID=172846 RepID=A0AAV4R1V6_CAEEX|nr:hypothetical protein CEXT_567671 [Caerostris extrusa]
MGAPSGDLMLLHSYYEREYSSTSTNTFSRATAMNMDESTSTSPPTGAVYWLAAQSGHASTCQSRFPRSKGLALAAFGQLGRLSSPNTAGPHTPFNPTIRMRFRL